MKTKHNIFLAAIFLFSLIVFSLPAFSLDVVDARVAWIELQVKLTDPILSSSINEDTLYLLNDKGKLPRAVEVTPDGKLLIISTKKSYLQRPFVLVMTPALKDTAGQALGRGFIRVFNVLIHSLDKGKADWLIKVSENPRIEIEDLRRRIFSWGSSSRGRHDFWFQPPRGYSNRMSWKDFEDDTPHGGFLSSRNMKGRSRLDDEDFTDMHIEDVAGFCYQKPRHLGYLNSTPVITVSGVTDGTATSNDVQIGISVSDRNLFFSYNFLNFELYRSGALIQQENPYWLFVIAVDKGLKFSYNFLRFTIDKTPPRILLLNPSEDMQTNKPDLVIEGQVEGADKVTVNGQEVAIVNGTFQTETITLSPGPNPFTVVASDAAGNTDQRTFTVTYVSDMTPPEITVVSPADGSYTNAAAIMVSGTVTDESPIRKVLVNGNLAVVQGSNFVYEGLPLAQGSNTITVEAEDDVGNASSVSVTTVLDTVPPHVLIAAPSPDSYLRETAVLVQGQAGDDSPFDLLVNDSPVPVSGGSFSLSLDLEEGRHEITALAVDRAGNRATATVAVTVDVTPPVIKLVSPLENEILGAPSIPMNGKIEDANPFKIRINALDGRIIGTSFYLEGLPLQEGQNQISIEAEDRAGNTAQKDLIVVRDTIPPQISITSPPQNMLSALKILPVQGSVNDASSVEVRVNEIAAQVAGQTFSATVPLGEGLNTIKAVAKDKAGNTNMALANITIDTTAPVINLASPANGEILHASPVPVTGRIVEANLQSLKLNGADVSLQGNDFNALLALVEGENLISLQAVDRVGLQSEVQRTVYLDTAAPRVMSVLPADNSTGIPLQISVEAEFSEDIDSSTLTPDSFFLTRSDGVRLEGRISYSAKKAILTPAAPLPDSRSLTIDLTAEIRDTAGNALANPYHGGFITKDTTPPAPPALDPLPERTSLTAITVSGASDPLAHIEIEGGSVKAEAEAGDDGRFSITVDLVQNALNLLSITAKDASGNRSLPNTAAVFQDSAAFEVVEAEFFNNQLTIDFSKSLDPLTLTADNVYLVSQTGKEDGVLTLLSGDMRAVFNPANDLASAPFLLTVSRAVKDKDGSLLAYEYTKMFNQTGAECFVQSEAYSDFSGLPLEGAIVQLISVNGAPTQNPVPTTLTSKLGKYALSCPSGKLVIRIGKDGYTTGKRVVISTSGFSSEVLDTRLTPLNPQASLMTTEGGTLFVAEPEIRLIYPQGAVNETVSLKLTAVGGQGLRERLPYGWSPLAAVDVSPLGAVFNTPCTLKVKTASPVTPDQKPAVAFWDETRDQWIALYPPAVSSPYLEATIDKSGQYAFLIPDAAPVAPSLPVPGEPLPSVTPPPIPAIEKATLTYNPDEIFPDQRSRGSLVIQPVTPIASGIPVQAVINESYELLSGETATYPSYTSDLVSYNTGNPQSQVDFYVSPNQDVTITSLKIGTIATDLRKYFMAETGVLIGPDGGTVSGEGGAEIVIESGSVDNYIPVSIRAKDANTLSLPAPQGFRLLGAVDFSLGGYALKKTASLSLLLTAETIASLGDEPQLLAARLQKIESDHVWLLAQTSKIDGLKVASHASAEAVLPLSGVSEGGTYIFLAALSPMGYARGTVTDQGQPFPGALLSVDGQSLKSFSQSAGAYGQVGFLGSLEVSALNRISGDTGAAADTLSVKGETKILNIAIAPTGPEVVSVTPADGASGVIPETKVEVIFSEPIKASTFHAQHFYLNYGTTKVEGVYKLSSDALRGELSPSAPLPPDTLITATLTTGIQDLSSNPLAAVFSWTFRTKDLVPPQADPRLITVIIPDNGIVKVIGRPGSVEPGAIVTIINPETNETVTVAGLSDGSFETQIGASMSDRLLFQITDQAGNKSELAAGPYLSLDGRSAVLGSEPAEFLTPEGIGLKIEAGTFAGPVVAGLSEETNPLLLTPVSEKVERLKAVRIDFGGASPSLPVKLSVPAPAGVSSQDNLFIAREVSGFGGRKLMIVDSVSLKEGRLETNSPPWPGCLTADTYSFLRLPSALGTLMGTCSYFPSAVFTSSFSEFVYIAQLYSPGAHFRIPVGAGEDFTLTVRALDTGQTLYEETKQGPSSPGEDLILQENLSTDVQAPLLLNSALSDVYCFELARLDSQSQGIRVQASDADGNGLPDQNATVTIQGDAHCADEKGTVRLYNLTQKTSKEIKAGADGSFTTDISASFKDRILMTIQKGNIPLNQEISYAFSEPIGAASVNEDTVTLKEIRDGSETVIEGTAEVQDSGTVVVFKPSVALKENTVYMLVFSGILDLAENAVPEIKINFRTKTSAALGFVSIDSVSDSLLIGGYLYVASGEDGLIVVDVTNPLQMRPVASLYLPRARGVAKDDRPTLQLDSQGHLLVVGGGTTSNGYIKIIDITDPLNPVQIGTQSITERLGYASSYYNVGLEPPPTTLFEGSPRRVRSLGNLAFVGTVGAGFEIIDVDKIEELSSSKPGIILTNNTDIVNVMDLAAFQKKANPSVYLLTGMFSIWKGLMLFDATNPSLIQKIAEIKLNSSPQRLEVALDYLYDSDNDGSLDDETGKDLIFVSLSGSKIVILDMTDNQLTMLGEIQTPGATASIALDKKNGILYAHAADHLLIIDARHNLNLMALDANGDNVDDRILNQIRTRAHFSNAISVDSELNVAYIGDIDHGVESIRIDPPTIEIAQDTDGDGQYETPDLVVPHGLNKTDLPTDPSRSVYLTAVVPGGAGPQIEARLWSVNFEGDPLMEWGEIKPYLETVVLNQVSADPKSEKFNHYVSGQILVTADPKANAPSLKILSGDYLRAAILPESLMAVLRSGTNDGAGETFYVSEQELAQSFDYVKSVRTELVDSPEPNPANNSSTGLGELAGTVYLHSGEFALSEADIRIPGRGMDFELRRTYESQSIYSGPLGWNWDFSLNKRLLELPNGDLLYFDGNGRRERFAARKQGELIIGYDAPAGYFMECYRHEDGSATLQDEAGTVFIFNALGRLARIMDRNANVIDLAYDLGGKLSSAVDTMGRVIVFDYYPYAQDDPRSNRLKQVMDFSGRKVVYSYNEQGDLIEANFEGRVTKYEYSSSMDLIAAHNLVKVIDPKNQTAIENTYDGSDKVTGQTWGGISLGVNAGQNATTTDGNGHTRSYHHDSAGHAYSVTEGGYTTSYTHNTDGLITSTNRPNGNSAAYTYDSSNPSLRSRANLLQIVEQPGALGGGEPQRVTSFAYDSYFNQPLTISAPNGLVIQNTLDAQGNIISATPNIPGMESSYAFNSYGQLVSETDPLEGTRTYNYYPESSPGGGDVPLAGRALDPATGGYLMQTASPLASASYEYDDRGNLAASADSQGIQAFWNVDQFNLVTAESITGPGSISPYNYSAAYTHDANGNVETKSETWGGAETPVSRSLSFAYNQRDSLVFSTETGRGTTNYGYDGNENLSSVTDPEGKSISFGYDGRNLVSSFKRGADGPVNAFDYDGNKNLHVITDGRGKATTLSYDGYDRLKSVRDALGNETVVERAEMGNLSEIRKLDAGGNLIKSSLTVNDPLGRIAARTEKLLDPSGQTVEEIAYQYRYEEGGRVVVTIDPLGREARVIKNDLGKVIKEIDAAGNETEYYYEDGRGNMTRKIEKEKRPDGAFESFETRYEYNSFNKVSKITDELGHVWAFTYDEMGNLSGSLDPEGNQISHMYDQLGRKLKTEKHFANGAKQVTEFGYDNSNNIRWIKDGNGNTTQYDYDEINRLVRVTYPDTTFIEYTYDGNSNIVVEKQRNGTRVENTYDDINRLIARNIQKATGVEGPSAETYEYDAASRLIRAADEDSEVGFVYDSLDRLLEERQNGKSVKYTYDKIGNRTSVQYPNQRIIEREFDLLNRMAKVKQGAEAIVDMNFIGRTFRTLNKSFGNGDAITELYDLGRRLINREVKNKNAELINQYVYGYNSVGMKTFEQRGHEENKGDVFNYDELYRLNQVRMNSTEPQNPNTSVFEKSKTYTFDKVENILKIVETQNQQTRETLAQVNNLNQYTQFDALSLAHDGNGNLKQKGTAHYAYDYRNQLVSVQDTTRTTAFKYDVLGRRIEKTSTAAPTAHYYFDGYQVIEERDGSDQLQKQYVYGNGIDELVRMDKFSGSTAIPYYFHTNAIGSVTAITDNDGKLIERVSYDDYGKPAFTDYLTDPQNPTTRTTSIITNNYLFQGREYDTETGLYYFRARYFDPQLARFLQTDPVGYRDSMNLYQAFSQNPLNYCDPLGNYFVFDPNDQHFHEILWAIAAGALTESGNIIFYELLHDPRPIKITSGKLPDEELRIYEEGRRITKWKTKYGETRASGFVGIESHGINKLKVKTVDIVIDFHNIMRHWQETQSTPIGKGRIDPYGITTIYHELKHSWAFLKAKPDDFESYSYGEAYEIAEQQDMPSSAAGSAQMFGEEIFKEIGKELGEQNMLKEYVLYLKDNLKIDEKMLEISNRLLEVITLRIFGKYIKIF